MYGELSQLLLSAHKSAASGAGRLALVTGDSGVGKTYAVSRFLKSIPRDTFVALSAKARPQATTPFYPIYEALGDFLMQHAGEPETANLIARYHFSLPGL